MKVCSSCSKEKPFSEFYIFKKPSGKKYYWSICKSCNFETRKQYRKDYYEKNKDRLKIEAIARRYHIDADKYADIIAAGCAICGKTKGVKLCIDHDHACCPGQYTCGKCVRGVLCSQHNQALGLINDSLEVAESMVKYLRGGNN